VPPARFQDDGRVLRAVRVDRLRHVPRGLDDVVDGDVDDDVLEAGLAAELGDGPLLH
jgi:hypothetical protein